MRTHETMMRPEGLFYLTLSYRLPLTHPRTEELKKLVKYYNNGFAREQDVLNIMKHHPRRMSLANVIVNDGAEALRIDQLLIFETFSLILDVSYVNVPTMALENGELIRLRDMQALGNPLKDVKRKGEAFRRLADEQGWAIPPIRSEVLFVHSEDIFEESGPLPDGYKGALDMAEDLVAGVRVRGNRADQDAHQETVNEIFTYVMKSPADTTYDVLWRDPAFSDTVDTLTVGPRGEYDSIADLKETILDVLILRGEVMTEDEVACLVGAYNLDPDEEREIRELFGCMRHSGIGDYTLTESFALSLKLMSRFASHSENIAERLWDDVSV